MKGKSMGFKSATMQACCADSTIYPKPCGLALCICLISPDVECSTISYITADSSFYD